jgi:uncharacterized membrane protein
LKHDPVTSNHDNAYYYYDDYLKGVQQMHNPVIASIVRFLHLFAAVIWFGASTTNILILLPSVRKVLEPPVASKFAGEVTKRFRVIVYICIALLLSTGEAILRSSEEYMGFTQIVNFWSVITFIKHVFIVILIVLSIYSFEGLGRKVSRLAAKGLSPELTRSQTRQKIFSYIGFVVSIIILILTGILTA